jgi:hypothetical protein
VPLRSSPCWLGVCVGAALDREHGAVGFEQDPLRGTAEEKLADAGAVAEPDDDERGVGLLRDLQKVFAGLEEGVRGSDVDGEAGRGKSRSEVREVGADCGRRGVVVVLGEVDDEQGKLPEQCLVAGA